MPYDLTFNVFWQTHKYIPFLKRDIPVQFISEEDDQAPTERQIALLDSLASLPEMVSAQISEWARKDFHERLKNWGLTPAELEIEIDEGNLQNHFSINEVLIPRIGDCTSDYVVLCGNCDWDEEHGIEFLLKNGIPVRCNAQEGLALSEEWDKILKE